MFQSQQGTFEVLAELDPQADAYIYPETILREVKRLYEVEYRKSLVVVEDYWLNHDLIDEDERELPLHDFAERRIVADPAVIGNTSKFPGLVLAMGNLASVDPEIQSQQFQNWYQQTVQIAYMLKSLSSEELSIIMMRHVQATLDLFRRYPTANISGLNFSLAETPTFQPSANAFPSGGNALVKGVLVTLQVKFMGYGI